MALVQSSFSELIAQKFRSALSICLLILGKRGSGKTDLALLVAETLALSGVIDQFATNIKIVASPFPIEHINNLRDLESWCQSNARRKLFIFDEMGKTVRRRTPMSSMNIQMIDNLQILRKYKLSLVIIAPAEKYIDSAVLGSDILDCRIIKPNNKNPKIGIYIDEDENEQIMLYEIPPTSIKFDTFDTAIFTKEDMTSKIRFDDEKKQFLYDVYKGIKTDLTDLERKHKQRWSSEFIITVLEKELVT